MKITIGKEQHTCIGQAIISSKGNPESKQIKYFFENGKSLLIIPDENIAYLGINHGQIKEFDNFPPEVIFNGEKMKQVNADYQIEVEKIFGWTEGECQFWDYESNDENMFISTAILTKTNQRADVILNRIDTNSIKGPC